MEIQNFKKNIAKSNRKLARDIASWVSTAMSAEGKKGVSSRKKNENGEDDDLGVLGEEEGDGEEEEELGAQQQGIKLKANK